MVEKKINTLNELLYTLTGRRIGDDLVTQIVGTTFRCDDTMYKQVYEQVEVVVRFPQRKEKTCCGECKHE